MHIFIYVWGNREWDSEEYWDYQKVRSCRMRWMQDFSFGAQITQTRSEVERWESQGTRVPLTMRTRAQMWMNMHACTREKQMWVYVCTCPHTQSCTVRSQSAYILLGCAPISRINEEVSHFTVTQHAGLWGTNGYSLQFLRSVFNNVIDF